MYRAVARSFWGDEAQCAKLFFFYPEYMVEYPDIRRIVKDCEVLNFSEFFGWQIPNCPADNIGQAYLLDGLNMAFSDGWVIAVAL